ncbi:MAG: YeeE/YedE thiosulfate transporter family protein [Planctomycetota bacterium]|nr:YeeE/YedE thiosulfate transporter family protein [Planctomycetota bacterium]
MSWLEMKEWSPYAVGAGIGVLSWLAFVLLDTPLGCSTAYARTSGMIERLFRGKKVYEKPYYRKFVPAIEWEWMFVVGIAAGAAISAGLSGAFVWVVVPEFWALHAGPSAPLRIAVALAGGAILGFGARWANGCTSGHGISGTLQLAASSWLAVVCFFVAGVLTATLFFSAFSG